MIPEELMPYVSIRTLMVIYLGELPVLANEIGGWQNRNGVVPEADMESAKAVMDGGAVIKDESSEIR